jgi:hypothetical protein
MKQIIAIFRKSFGLNTNANTQNVAAKPKNISTNIACENHFSSSILLWMRTDKPRQEGMNRWKGPHAKIISANKGLWEYRQIHFSENNLGLWQNIDGVETKIPNDRKIDGVADVTLKNLFSIFRGKKQNKLASVDEVNLFKRTILYASFPKNSKWYNVVDTTEKIEARSMVFFRKKEGVSDKDFKKFFNDELVPSVANTGVLKELRSKVYNPWKQSQWNTPNVAHDNAKEVQFQASLILGFADKSEMKKFFNSENLKILSDRIAIFCSAVHAYEIEETLTFVKNGKELSSYQK